MSPATPASATCPNCHAARWCLAGPLEGDGVDLLAGIVKPWRSLQVRQTIYHQGEHAASLYVVKTGSVKSCLTAPDGVEQVVAFHLPGDLFGLDGLERRRRPSAAIALEHTTVCELPLADVEALCRKFPSLLHWMLAAFSRDIGAEQDLHLTLGQRSAERRVAVFLAELSRRRKQRGFPGDDLTLSMSRHDIASYLGVSPETVSRVFSSLQERGIITVERRLVRIIDPPKLAELSESGSGSRPADVARRCASPRIPVFA
jgi:CRP/FNR family transcriptional regulator